MMTPQEILLANETELATVAAVLADAARARGGTMLATAAEVHALCATPSPLWPRSALELERRTLPRLARRPGHAGATVQALGGLGRGMWQVIAAPLPRPVAPTPPPVSRAVPAAPLPVPSAPPAAADAGAEPEVTEAEFQRVRAALAAAEEAHDDEERRRHLEKRRVARHEMNLARLDELGAAS